MKSILILLIGLIILCGCLSVHQEISNPSYYSYGDSITRATKYDDLNVSGDDCYIIQMIRQYQPDKTADQNLDGGSKTSLWGKENIETHFPLGTEHFIIMFGTNDENLPPNLTADNLISMVEFAESHGARPIILIPPLYRGNSINSSIENQTLRIEIIQKKLDNNDIQYVKIYDALDSIPDNDQLDLLNLTYYASDGVHPNKTGQKKMGEYLFFHMIL